jgi:hypothetical protein
MEIMVVLNRTAIYGDVIKQVLVSCHAAAAGYFDVLIDNYYRGQIFFRDGAWQANLSRNSDLTIDDIQILGAEMEQAV